MDVNGRLDLLKPVAADGQSGQINCPIDISLSGNGDFLYVLNTGSLVSDVGRPSISVFKVDEGVLKLVDNVSRGFLLGISSSDDIQGVFGLAVL